jgi:hypothetical protein
MIIGSTVTCYFTIDGTWKNFSGNIPVPVGQWTHVAITYDPTPKTAKIYVNGVLDTQATYTSSPGKVSSSTSTLYLGQNDWASMGSELDGKIDSLRISNIARVFTPLYAPSAGPATPPGNLVPNGDFEMGLVGWRSTGYGDANLSWETTGGAYSGQKCLHALASPTLSMSLYSRPIPVHPGRKYALSMRMKSSGSNLYPRVEIDFLGTSITTAPSFSGGTYPTVTSSWTLINSSTSGCSGWTFTVPTTTTAPMMAVMISEPTGPPLYVDDVRLIVGDGPYVLALKDKISVGPTNAMPAGSIYFSGVSSPTR